MKEKYYHTEEGKIIKMTTIEGNKLIEAFMERYGRWIKDCKYHNSWEELMPVVEKIEAKGNTFVIDGCNAYAYENGKILESKTGTGETKIEAVWNCIVKHLGETK